ncbi:MAG: UDP-N-acetylmuramate dehydrogenase [Hormoscilla sp. GUM202]|nr:UDP-N-acetylmuramate dehydrogenase [Hormoscilla sp. GM7CHS1pb]MBO1349318.1 UDP-N-acetylmuramate dehydrogenase [Hormoscilla sp. GUM202]
MADATLKRLRCEHKRRAPSATRTEINIPGTKCSIYTQVSLANLTSYRVGGPAEWYIDPHSLSDLQQMVAWARSKGLAITVLGAGSNLLVSDLGLPGLAVCTRNLRYTKFDQKTSQVISGAGVPIARLARQVARQGWQGLEWAVGIPGTVGGAVVMNAGAHKSCIADILVSAQVLSQTGTTEKLRPSDLGYGYRISVLQGGESLVTEATFQLQPVGDPVGVMATTKAHLKQRHATQPYHLPSCGSVFRNQEPYKAGWLIEQTGLKGYKIGGAQVSELHANFILNCGSATASDIFKLIGYVQDRVEQRWSIRLEPEVKIMGEF